jgi:arsenite methyltransferase
MTTDTSSTTGTTAEALKKEVSDFYGGIARAQTSSGCGPGSACCGVSPGASMSESYEGKEGYLADADLGLGCGVPTEFADLRAGHTVLDLGSGAGNDAFVARATVGDTGHVIGVDMTPDMLARARENAASRGFNNVEFRLGEIEHLPVTSGTVDRILSNCVLNLVPDKDAAHREMFRVLKPSGSFSVSDIAMEGAVSPEIRSAAALYVGCVSGAVTRDAMVRSLEAAGFTNVQMPKVVTYPIDVAMVRDFLPAGADAETLLKDVQVYKITVTGTKPGTPAEVSAEKTATLRMVGKPVAKASGASEAPCCGPACCS